MNNAHPDSVERKCLKLLPPRRSMLRITIMLTMRDATMAMSHETKLREMDSMKFANVTLLPSSREELQDLHESLNKYYIFWVVSIYLNSKSLS